MPCRQLRSSAGAERLGDALGKRFQIPGAAAAAEDAQDPPSTEGNHWG